MPRRARSRAASSSGARSSTPRSSATRSARLGRAGGGRVLASGVRRLRDHRRRRRPLEAGPAGGVPESRPHLARDRDVALELGEPVAHGVDDGGVAEVDDDAVGRRVGEHAGHVADRVHQQLADRRRAGGDGGRSMRIGRDARRSGARGSAPRPTPAGCSAGRACRRPWSPGGSSASRSRRCVRCGVPVWIQSPCPRVRSSCSDRPPKRLAMVAWSARPIDRRQHRRGGEERQHVETGEPQAGEDDEGRDGDLDDVAQERRHVDPSGGRTRSKRTSPTSPTSPQTSARIAPRWSRRPGASIALVSAPAAARARPTARASTIRTTPPRCRRAAPAAR